MSFARSLPYSCGAAARRFSYLRRRISDKKKHKEKKKKRTFYASRLGNTEKEREREKLERNTNNRRGHTTVVEVGNCYYLSLSQAGARASVGLMLVSVSLLSSQFLSFSRMNRPSRQASTVFQRGRGRILIRQSKRGSAARCAPGWEGGACRDEIDRYFQPVPHVFLQHPLFQGGLGTL